MVVVRLSCGGGSQLVVVRLSFGGGVTAGCRSVVIRWGGHSWLSFGCHSVGVHSWLSFGCHSVGGHSWLSFGCHSVGGHSWLSFGCHSVGGSQLVVVRLSFGRGVTAGCRSVVIRWGDHRVFYSRAPTTLTNVGIKRSGRGPLNRRHGNVWCRSFSLTS